MSTRKKIALCLVILAIFAVVSSLIMSTTGQSSKPSPEADPIATTQPESSSDQVEPITIPQLETSPRIQWEKVYSEFEKEIIASYGEVDVEKLTSENPFEESNPGDIQSYQIRLDHLNKERLSKLTEKLTQVYGLKYEIKDVTKSREKGIQIDLIKGVEQRLIILFFEIPPPEQEGVATSTPEPVLRQDLTTKRLAIIIDDLGNNYSIFQRLLKIAHAIPYSILPMLPLSQQLNKEAHERGHEILLHTPMEPKDMVHNNPGPGVLLIDDSPPELVAKLKQDLASISFAVGINNHMGSAFTQDKESLDQIMGVLNERGLFFIDSKTAPGNISKTSALEHGVLYLSRNIFLDNAPNTEYITRQLNKAANIALKYGSAIAIGHPHTKTIEVLESELQGVTQRGITVVPVSSLLVQ
jgi:polysaccharide deacetylase 2 family uncharacterized protein YibQ